MPRFLATPLISTALICILIRSAYAAEHMTLDSDKNLVFRDAPALATPLPPNTAQPKTPVKAKRKKKPKSAIINEKKS